MKIYPINPIVDKSVYINSPTIKLWSDMLPNLYERGALRRTRTIHLLAKKGIFGPEAETFPDLVAKFFDDTITALKSVFPDNWEIIVPISNGDLGLPEVLIRFPELEITNQVPETHTLRELFVLIPFGFSNNHATGEAVITLGKPKGFRMKYTHKEYFSKYVHSHLSTLCRFDKKEDFRRVFTDNFYNDFNFCVDEEDFSSINTEFLTNLHPDLHSLLYYYIISLVTWESLAGKPYKRMNCISSGSNNPIDLSRRDGLSVTITEYFTARVQDPQNEYLREKLKFTYVNGYKLAISDEVLERIVIDELLQAAIGINSQSLLRSYLVLKNAEADQDNGFPLVHPETLIPLDTQFQIPFDHHSLMVETTPYLMFRGQQIPFTVAKPIKQTKTALLEPVDLNNYGIKSKSVVLSKIRKGIQNILTEGELPRIIGRVPSQGTRTGGFLS